MVTRSVAIVSYMGPMGLHVFVALRGARSALSPGALFLALFALVSACAGAERPTARYPSGPGGPLEVRVAERALIVAVRPGDETLTAAGLAQRVIKRVGTVSTVLLSSGEGAPDLLAAGPAALERKADAGSRELSNEARVAARVNGRGLIRLALFGFPPAQLAALGCEPEFRARLPGASCGGVRRVMLLQPGARKELRLSAAARSVKLSILGALKQMPTLVVFPDPHEGEPEQRAVGLLTVLAIREHMRGRSTPWPRALAYVTQPGAWPRALSRVARDPDMPPIEPPRMCLTLNQHERARKREALAAYQKLPRLRSTIRDSAECFTENAPEHLELTASELLDQRSASQSQAANAR